MIYTSQSMKLFKGYITSSLNLSVHVEHILDLFNYYKFVKNIMHTISHSTHCISPRPISTLGPSVLWLTCLSRADAGCNLEMVCIILYV